MSSKDLVKLSQDGLKHIIIELMENYERDKTISINNIIFPINIIDKQQDEVFKNKKICSLILKLDNEFLKDFNYILVYNNQEDIENLNKFKGKYFQIQEISIRLRDGQKNLIITKYNILNESNTEKER